MTGKKSESSLKVYKKNIDNDKKVRFGLSKYITNNLTFRLLKLDSELTKAYLNTFYCSTELTVYEQDNKEYMQSNYCKNRFCLTCNRIKTGKYINEYLKSLSNLLEPVFVTLTVVNCEKKDIEKTIDNMNKDFLKIRNRLSKQKIKIVGIRKLEVTYNNIKNNYHPHYHLIIENKETAEKILKYWLEYNRTAKIQAQDIRDADIGSIKEIFKYFTKLVTKNNKFIESIALDNIFTAIRGKRIFFTYGLEKDNQENEKIEFDLFDENNRTYYKYYYQIHDWMSNDGILFTGITKKDIDKLNIEDHEKFNNELTEKETYNDKVNNGLDSLLLTNKDYIER